jgi:hypothetical protein
MARRPIRIFASVRSNKCDNEPPVRMIKGFDVSSLSLRRIKSVSIYAIARERGRIRIGGIGFITRMAESGVLRMDA